MTNTTELAAAAAVATVLRAPDHYAAIDAARGATMPELRQCYVRASLRVHPDKNSHPDATRAFQRVAAAWRELGDEKARWRYDQNLDMGYGGSDDIGVQGSDHIPPEEAFAAFARATAACGACGPFGDCADTLMFAQQMAQAQAQMGGGHPGGMGHPAFQQPEQSLQSVGSGVAYSAGLWIAGLAVSAAGFNTVGGFMRRCAFVQGFGQVAMGGLIAYQNPEVKRSIEAHTFLICERAAPMKSALASASAAVRLRVEDAVSSELVEQLSSSLGGMQSCLPVRRLAAPEASKEALRKAGTRVTLTNLRATAELNGRLCEVVRFDGQRERYVVRLLPEGVSVFMPGGSSAATSNSSYQSDAGRAVDNMKLVKLDNLRLAPAVSSERAPKTLTQFM